MAGATGFGLGGAVGLNNIFKRSPEKRIIIFYVYFVYFLQLTAVLIIIAGYLIIFTPGG